MSQLRSFYENFCNIDMHNVQKITNENNYLIKIKMAYLEMCDFWECESKNIHFNLILISKKNEGTFERKLIGKLSININL